MYTYIYMKIDFISIFPDAFSSYLKESIIQRAQKKKLVSFRCINPRDFAKDTHKTVDGSPYGGGPGMVMKVEPILKAVMHARKTRKKERVRVILFSLRGKKFSQSVARRLSKYNHLIFICGRYEGVDERVAQHVADEEISIGDFVLSGGELPALVVSEAVIRHIPGVLGKISSLEESKGSYPVYTRPPVFEMKKGTRKVKLKVPDVLMSGDHTKIESWRRENGEILE